MKLNVLRADPAGNITLFVLDPIERERIRQKMYGTMNAPIASFVALMPVFIGFDFAIAEPA